MDSWEKDLDARLKKLPSRRAPANFAAAVLLRAQPWHHRPWYTWNAAGRLAFVLCVAAGAVALASGLRLGVDHFLSGWSWTWTLARVLRPAILVMCALAVAPFAALTYIKEKA